MKECTRESMIHEFSVLYSNYSVGILSQQKNYKYLKKKANPERQNADQPFVEILVQPPATWR